MPQRKLVMTDDIKHAERELRQILKIKPSEGDCSELYDELKDAAWNVLHDCPGCDCGDWMQELFEQYPSEVVDALGVDPYEVRAQLEDWWDSMDYEDERTGMCERYRDWAEYFCTEKSVELYDWVVQLSAELNNR